MEASDPARAGVTSAVVTSSPSTTGSSVWTLVAIAIGGAIGAAARYGLAEAIDDAPHRFPWATFCTNVAGSYAIGVVLMIVLERYPSSRFVQPFVATGVLGSFTTYSSFAVENDVLVKDGNVGTAIAAVAASLVVGLCAAWAGISSGRWLSLVLPTRRDGS